MWIVNEYSKAVRKKLTHFVQNAPEAKSCGCALKLNYQNKQEVWEYFLPLPGKAVQVVIATSLLREAGW